MFRLLKKDGQPEFAVLPIELYHRLLEQAEDAEDIRTANDAMSELASGGDELVPADVARKLLQDGQHRLKVWREHRGNDSKTARIHIRCATGIYSAN